MSINLFRNFAHLKLVSTFQQLKKFTYFPKHFYVEISTLKTQLFQQFGKCTVCNTLLNENIDIFSMLKLYNYLIVILSSSIHNVEMLKHIYIIFQQINIVLINMLKCCNYIDTMHKTRYLRNIQSMRFEWILV